MKKARGSLLVAGFMGLSMAGPASQSAPIKADAAYELATQAYLFAYPLVLMERTRLAAPNRPVNEFVHAHAHPGPEARTVVRLQMLDAWTETFPVPGTRTTGNKAGQFALVGPSSRSQPFRFRGTIGRQAD